MRGLTLKVFIVILATGFLSAFSCRETTAQRRASARLSPPGTPPTISNAGVLVCPARYPRWFSLGKGPLTLVMGNPYPLIQIDKSSFGATPPYGYMGGNKPFSRRALTPRFPLGAFVAKTGATGEPFMPFAEYRYFRQTGIFPDYRFDTDEEIFVGINDSDYSDNRGAYQFRIIDREAISGARLVRTENCYGEHCQIWQVALVKSDGWYDTGIPLQPNQHIRVFCRDDHCSDVQSGIVSLKVDDVTVQTEDNTGKSLYFATQDYYQEFLRHDYQNMHIVGPNWSSTLQIRINDSFPKRYLKNLEVLIGPAKGM